jgi:hypothetical protein
MWLYFNKLMENNQKHAYNLKCLLKSRIRRGLIFTVTRVTNDLRLYHRRLVIGFSPRRPGFGPMLIHVGFVVGKVAPGQDSLRTLRFSLVNIIPHILHFHSCIIWGIYKGPVSGRNSTGSRPGTSFKESDITHM